LRFFFEQFIFCHHEFTDHSSGFPDVQLVWPIAVVCEFIFGQTPLLKFLLNLFGYTRIIRHKIQQAFLVVLMFFNDLLSALVASFRVIIIHSYVVATKWTMVVCVCLPVWNDVELLKPFSPSGIKNSHQKLILRRIIISRPWEGHPVVWMI